MTNLLRLTIILGVLGLAACDRRGGDDVGRPDPTPSAPDLVDRGIPPLTAAEIRIYLRDSTLVHEGSSRVWFTYFRDDGSVSGYSEVPDNGGVEQARGTWQTTDDNQICGLWENDWSGGEFRCAEVFKYGDDYVFAPPPGSEGKEVRRRRIPGNPKNL